MQHSRLEFFSQAILESQNQEFIEYLINYIFFKEMHNWKTFEGTLFAVIVKQILISHFDGNSVKMFMSLYSAMSASARVEIS